MFFNVVQSLRHLHTHTYKYICLYIFIFVYLWAVVVRCRLCECVSAPRVAVKHAVSNKYSRLSCVHFQLRTFNLKADPTSKKG